MRQADTLRRAGDGAGYSAKLDELTLNGTIVRTVAWNKATNLFETSRDGRMLAQMLQQHSGTPHRLIPRSDGKWDVEINGVVPPGQEGRTVKSLLSEVRRGLSLKTVADLNKAAVARHTAISDKALELQMKLLIETYKGANAANKAILAASYKLTEGNDGTFARILPDGRIVTATVGETQSPDGEGDPIPKITLTTSPAPPAGVRKDPSAGLVSSVAAGADPVFALHRRAAFGG